MVLYKESIAGPSRLELYRKEDDATAPPMVIELNTVTSVVAVEGKMEFMISFADSQVTFACQANADVQDWVSDINRCRGVDSDTTHTSASNGTALYDGEGTGRRLTCPCMKPCACVCVCMFTHACYFVSVFVCVHICINTILCILGDGVMAFC